MEFRYCYNGEDYVVGLEQQADGTYLAHIGGRAVPVAVQHTAGGQFTLLVDGQRVHAYTAHTRSPQTRTPLRYVALADRETCVFELEKVTGSESRPRAGLAATGVLTAQMPGQVMQVEAAPGEHVEEGQTLLILEAMKMEIRVAAPFAGTVARLLVAAGDIVERGQLLAEVAPAGD